MSPARSTVPLERDKNGHRILHHDHRGYAQGCGCEDCKAGRRKDARVRRAVKSSATPASARRAEAQKGDEGKRDDTVSVRLSEQEAAAYRKHVAAIGDTESGFARDLILAAIGYEDDARRPARRRPNYKRTETEGQQT
jgi:hypothetical protein